MIKLTNQQISALANKFCDEANKKQEQENKTKIKVINKFYMKKYK